MSLKKAHAGYSLLETVLALFILFLGISMSSKVFEVWNIDKQLTRGKAATNIMELIKHTVMTTPESDSFFSLGEKQGVFPNFVNSFEGSRLDLKIYQAQAQGGVLLDYKVLKFELHFSDSVTKFILYK